jgi:hypothetical protein
VDGSRLAQGLVDAIDSFRFDPEDMGDGMRIMARMIDLTHLADDAKWFDGMVRWG